MSKALIVYGTRFGATANTSEEIGKILREQGLDVRVVNAKKEKIKDIAEYNLVVVGSGIAIGRWTGEPEDFLKRFKSELAKKKVALFVCCGSASDTKSKKEGEPSPAEAGMKKYLQEKAAKYNLQPATLGLFGGVYDFNTVPWYAKKVFEMERPRLEASYKENPPGVFDTRNWDAIRNWAKELISE